MNIYICGSLRNPIVIDVAKRLQDAGFAVFADWMAAGPEADDYWQKFEKAMGRTYREALASPAAINTFSFDMAHIDKCDAMVMVAPFGKSACLELGYVIGTGRPGFILMDEPGKKDRWDLMLKLATDIAYHVDELIEGLHAWVAFTTYGKEAGC